MKRKKITSHITTAETLSTAPARFMAQQAIADFSDRQLAHFHWQKAIGELSDIEHKLRDYSDERSPIDPIDADQIFVAVEKIKASLAHVAAIATESGERTRRAIVRHEVKKGGAK